MELIDDLDHFAWQKLQVFPCFGGGVGGVWAPALPGNLTNTCLKKRAFKLLLPLVVLGIWPQTCSENGPKRA